MDPLPETKHMLRVLHLSQLRPRAPHVPRFCFPRGKAQKFLFSHAMALRRSFIFVRNKAGPIKQRQAKSPGINRICFLTDFF
jgi:hypothetical protein